MSTPEPLSAAEHAALLEIRAWKDPAARGRFRRVSDRVERTLAWLIGLVPLNTVERVLGWVLPRATKLTWRATSTPMVLAAYRREGTAVDTLADIARLDIAVADRVAGDKRVHEGAVAGVEGLATGFVGLPALPADVSGLLLLSIRAVQSRGLAYGFDPSVEDDFAFVLAVLDGASQISAQSKASGRTAALAIGRRLGQGAVTEGALKAIMGRLPKQLAARLLAMKSESAVPLLGAITSGGFNAWYLQSVTAFARMAYRERFLRRKHGDDLLLAYGL